MTWSTLSISLSAITKICYSAKKYSFLFLENESSLQAKILMKIIRKEDVKSVGTIFSEN